MEVHSSTDGRYKKPLTVVLAPVEAFCHAMRFFFSAAGEDELTTVDGGAEGGGALHAGRRRHSPTLTKVPKHHEIAPPLVILREQEELAVSGQGDGALMRLLYRRQCGRLSVP